MILFQTGLTISTTEHQALLHLAIDPEQWLRDAITEKVAARKQALINEWRPRFFADPAITVLPADEEELVELIMARPEYRSRLQSDADQVPPKLPYQHNMKRFADRRVTGSVKLFPVGLVIPDMAAACILAYVQDLDDWVIGALLGQINRGRKKILTQYQPLLLADPDVTTIPADEEALIQVIVMYENYKTLPQQMARGQ